MPLPKPFYSRFSVVSSLLSHEALMGYAQGGGAFLGFNDQSRSGIPCMCDVFGALHRIYDESI